ncbi:cerebellar degeneration-related protein 2-like isoform X1 [Phymastichus coffea]|uniref:cerebellar degeneration-related protein 2-like isoform X1 n=1 Tax=Phymastichus coffea TaxID=108790 RepID=UPI00273BE565|nr:cerebellar degeneration-related protein 2-like isoform X1 [Phymastichus coffea]
MNERYRVTMATLEEFESAWELLTSSGVWAGNDLQLAAELGKTLLERNKELENCIKIHQCTIEDQAQEIEYMKKQTAALREVNDSRLKIYEQLEVSIQDLERANQRLALENANDKKQIKSQCLTIDNLETRTDDLQKKLDAVNGKYEAILRERTRNQSPADGSLLLSHRTESSRDGSTHNLAVSPRRFSPDEEARLQQIAAEMSKDEDVAKLLKQLQESRHQRSREQKRVEQLKEQLDTLLHEHAQMEEQLNVWKAKAQDMKNLQDEINTLEEVRQGNLCGRCLRGTDPRVQEDLTAMLDQEEEVDELSLAESLPESLREGDTTFQEFGTKKLAMEDDHSNPYRVLVDKYEALLKIQKRSQKPTGMSLQEELQMSGEFNNPNSSEPESGRSSLKKKPFSITPTDFSEAETSSSGFSDETSNKSTQTEGRPGSFLCSIADGEEYKFSIYDDNSTFEQRFHQMPEYRKIFNEIFEVLKRAAEAIDEGTDLPLLDSSDGGDLTPKAEHCPLVSVYAEDAPSELTDDTRSIASLAVSSVASEPVFRVHTPVFGRKPKPDQQQQQQQQQQTKNETTPDNSPAKRGEPAAHRQLYSHRQAPQVRQPLEYLQVQVRKKGSAKKSRRPGETTPDIIPTINPRVMQLKGSGRRKFRPLTSAELSDGFNWNGHTAHFYPSKSPRARHQQSQADACSTPPRDNDDYKPGSASEEVAKLRRLEMSYAEALRMPNKTGKAAHHRRQRH